MLLEKRLALFKASLAEKNVVLPLHSFRSEYNRLIFKRRALEFIISTLLFYGGQQFLIANAFFAPMWLTTGAALAAIFLRGNFLLLGIFAGTLIAYLANHLSWDISLLLSLIFVIYIYLMRKLAFLTIGPIVPLYNNAVLWKFYALIAVLSAVYSYVFFTLMVLKSLSGLLFFWVFMGWLAQINGILCVTLICLVFDPYVMYRHFHKVRLWSILAVVIVICHLFYFFVPAGIPSLVLSILFFAIFCVYAKYFGKVATCTMLLGVSVIYLGGITAPFHLFHANSSELQVMVTLALFTLSAMLSISIATAIRTPTFNNP
ncbi:MAG TPA: hypothetical protein VHE99_00780 [Gammaproteobacteria bacterium]|nr:hypothetical protein [Gammaproteobacteria bacterium]